MRVVSLKEFMQLPEGTVYEQTINKGPTDFSGDTGTLMIKGNVGEVFSTGLCDWLECPLAGSNNIETSRLSDSLDGFFYLREKPGNTASMSVDLWGRHGMYPDVNDPLIQFTIYEKGDILKIIAMLLNAVVMSDPDDTPVDLAKELEVEQSLSRVSLPDVLVKLQELIPTLRTDK